MGRILALREAEKMFSVNGAWVSVGELLWVWEGWAWEGSCVRVGTLVFVR